MLLNIYFYFFCKYPGVPMDIRGH